MGADQARPIREFDDVSGTIRVYLLALPIQETIERPKVAMATSIAMRRTATAIWTTPKLAESAATIQLAKYAAAAMIGSKNQEMTGMGPAPIHHA